MIKQLKKELPFALFLLMVGLAFALAYGVLSGLWLLLSAGQPASWYLFIALIVMAVGWAKSASSVWFVFIRDTALAAAIGFALLAVVVAWFIKGVNQGDMNDETVRMLANSEFYFVQWHEKLETFGQFAAVLVPLSLVGLTLAGSGISRSVWARNIFWLQRVSKYLLGGVTVAASFSMFGSDAILGKAASAERTHLKAVMRYVTEKEHENLLKVAQLRVETAAMTDISTNQKKFIAETIGAVWNVPKLTQEGRVILAIQAGREVLAKSSAPVISNDHDGSGSSQYSEVDAEKDIAKSGPRNALQRRIALSQQAEDHAALERRQFDARRIEIAGEIASTLTDSGNDLFKKQAGLDKGLEAVTEGISNLLEEVFHLNMGLLKIVIDPILEKAGDIAYEHLSEPIELKLKNQLQAHIQKALENQDVHELAQANVDVSLKYLKLELPAVLIERAKSNPNNDDALNSIRRSGRVERTGAASLAGKPSVRSIGYLQLPNERDPVDAQITAAVRVLDLFADAGTALGGDSAKIQDMRQQIVQVNADIARRTQVQEVEKQRVEQEKKIQEEQRKFVEPHRP